MKTIQYNPPAFPLSEPATFYPDGSENSDPIFQSGMTLRDYFAAAALQGLLAYGWMHNMPPELSHPSFVAERAYMYADALLEKRKEDDELPF